MAAIIATNMQPKTSKFLYLAKIVPETLQAKMPNISSQNIKEVGSKRVINSGVRASELAARTLVEIILIIKSHIESLLAWLRS